MEYLENMKYRSSEPKSIEAVEKYVDWGINRFLRIGLYEQRSSGISMGVTP